jgi:protein-tyrosine phosphatase
MSLYWIDGLASGRLAIAARPRGGEWLADEMIRWRAAGVDLIVSLLPADEAADLELVNEAAACKVAGLDFVLHPISDRGLPENAASFARLVSQVVTALNSRQSVLVHCRMGIVRSSLLAACVLGRLGNVDEDYFDRIRRARGFDVPDTAEQADWVRSWLESDHGPNEC